MEEILINLNFTSLGWKIGLPLILIAIDIISGLIQALINDDFQSSVMRKGLYHKVLEMLVIFSGFMFHLAFALELISTCICIYVTIMEISSILENLTKAGLDLGPLSKILHIYGEDELADTIDDNTKKPVKKVKK